MLKLKENEEIRLTKRRHPIVLVFRLFPFVVLAVILISAMVALPVFYQQPDWLEVVYEHVGEFNFFYLLYFTASALLFILWQLAFFLVVTYHLDCWIVTDERTIHTELKGLFKRYIGSIYHHKIQDVSVDVGGLLATYLDYGDLQIQTAGNFREFLFKQIPAPYDSKKKIMKIQRNYLKQYKPRKKDGKESGSKIQESNRSEGEDQE